MDTFRKNIRSYWKLTGNRWLILFFVGTDFLTFLELGTGRYSLPISFVIGTAFAFGLVGSNLFIGTLAHDLNDSDNR